MGEAPQNGLAATGADVPLHSLRAKLHDLVGYACTVHKLSSRNRIGRIIPEAEATEGFQRVPRHEIRGNA